MSRKKISQRYDLTTAGLMFPISIAVGFGMGYFLDNIFKTSPWFTIILSIYGIIAGFYNLYKINKVLNETKK